MPIVDEQVKIKVLEGLSDETSRTWRLPLTQLLAPVQGQNTTGQYAIRTATGTIPIGNIALDAQKYSLSGVRVGKEVEIDTDEEAFPSLVHQWREETGLYSSILQKSIHPGYQRIIGMGRKAIPWILRELEQKPDHWFWALRTLANENPVRPEQAGNIQQMRDAWLQWGRQKGYLNKRKDSTAG